MSADVAPSAPWSEQFIDVSLTDDEIRALEEFDRIRDMEDPVFLEAMKEVEEESVQTQSGTGNLGRRRSLEVADNSSTSSVSRRPRREQSSNDLNLGNPSAHFSSTDLPELRAEDMPRTINPARVFTRQETEAALKEVARILLKNKKSLANAIRSDQSKKPGEQPKIGETVVTALKDSGLI